MTHIGVSQGWIDMQCGACHNDCMTLGGRNEPAVWHFDLGKAYLIFTWLVQEHRLAQVHSINQGLAKQADVSADSA